MLERSRSIIVLYRLRERTIAGAKIKYRTGADMYVPIPPPNCPVLIR